MRMTWNLLWDLCQKLLSASQNRKLFDLIKMINSSSPIDICKMSLKEIYKALLDHNMLKGIDNSIIPLHVEIKLPWINWNLTWKCLRRKGICGMSVSTMYKAILNILPTHERLACIGSNDSNGMCLHCPTKIEDCWHALSQCCLSQDTAKYLLGTIQRIQPSASIPDILYLQWEHKEYFLSLSWLAISGIDIIWSHRLSRGIRPLPF